MADSLVVIPTGYTPILYLNENSEYSTLSVNPSCDTLCWAGVRPHLWAYSFVRQD